MPIHLKRYYGQKHLHFITCSCYRRLRYLGTPEMRDRFLRIFEDVRRKYRFVVIGFVIMPEHVHLLISEPEIGNPSLVMQVLKQRVSRGINQGRVPHPLRSKGWEGKGECPAQPFWQTRFHDFNVFTSQKRIEKLRYMHRNPVKRGLAGSPEMWVWSSFRFYKLREEGEVKIQFEP